MGGARRGRGAGGPTAAISTPPRQPHRGATLGARRLCVPPRSRVPGLLRPRRPPCNTIANIAVKKQVVLPIAWLNDTGMYFSDMLPSTMVMQKIMDSSVTCALKGARGGQRGGRG